MLWSYRSLGFELQKLVALGGAHFYLAHLGPPQDGHYDLDACVTKSPNFAAKIGRSALRFSLDCHNEIVFFQTGSLPWTFRRNLGDKNGPCTSSELIPSQRWQKAADQTNAMFFHSKAPIRYKLQQIMTVQSSSFRAHAAFKRANRPSLLFSTLHS
jgi:hypothetical protein